MPRSNRPNPERRYALLLALLAETDGRCFLCATMVDADAPAWHSDRAEVGHIVPDAKGGTYEITNLIILCRACNDVAGDNDLSAYVPNTRTAPTTMTDGQARRQLEVRRSAHDDAKRERRGRWTTA